MQEETNPFAFVYAPACLARGDCDKMPATRPGQSVT